MRATDHLHRLIHSLSGNEKRYFKLYAQRHSPDTQYASLFDALAEMQEYDESEFKHQHRTQRFVKHYADAKKNLTELLVRSLRSYHSENNPDNLLSNYIQDAEIFRLKRQTYLQEKTIERAKKLAYEYERWNTLLQILDIEYGYILENKQEQLAPLLNELFNEQNFVLQMIQTVGRLRLLRNKVFTHSRMNLNMASDEVRKVFEAVLCDDVIANHQPGHYFSCDIHYYVVHSLYHRHCRNYNEHLHFSRLAFELYHRYPHQKKYQPAAYKIALYNYLNSCFVAGDLKPFPDLLKKAQAITASTADEEGEDWQNLIHLQIIYAINTAMFSDIPRLENEVNKGLKRYREKVNKARELTLYFNLACGYFLLESWDKMLDMLNRILNDKSDARNDLKLCARLYVLIAHFELRNIETLEYMLRNEERNSKKAGSLTQAAKALIAALRHLAHAPESAHRKLYKTELEAFESSNASDIARLEEAHLWLKARAQNTVLVELFKKTIS